MNYDKEYYSSTYDNNFISRQQGALENYFYGRESTFQRRIDYIMQFSQYISGKKILDLGCGVGTFALLFAKKGLHTVGLDISENSINKSRENARTFGIANAEFVLGDCTKGHFQKDCFDAIIAADIIEHLPEPALKQTLHNCYQWLRPDGSLIIHTFPTKYYHLLLGPRALLLLPLCPVPLWCGVYCIPKVFAPFYVSLAACIFNLKCAISDGESYLQQIASSPHCNPQHPFRFKSLLQLAGFKIVEYRLVEEVLTGLKEDMPHYGWCKDLINRYEIIRPSIVAVAKKVE